MHGESTNPAWTSAFARVFELCKMTTAETIMILSETGSRAVNVQLACESLTRMGLTYQHVIAPTPPPSSGPIIRSTGASEALGGLPDIVEQLCEADVIIDLTIEGLMHAPETGKLLQSGARIMTISNEHPDILSRLVPTPEIKEKVREAVATCRAATQMTVTSDAGTDLTVNMTDVATVGVWGFTDRPGTLAHWPAGLVVSFPKTGAVNGRLVFQPGDINLTFKRYFESAVTFDVENDFVSNIGGSGADAKLMRTYFEGFNDPLAYATSHVGWGMNPAARYEALTMYDKQDLNGTELRALAGNFLYSTGANEFANRFTRGHFDLPMMGCDIALDGKFVVEAGKPV
jgi:2,5-dihydroxypyridine 5,6-dioxygenase